MQKVSNNLSSMIKALPSQINAIPEEEEEKTKRKSKRFTFEKQ
jgi:hypothetical protein